MSVIDEFEEAREDLEALLLEVLGSLLGPDEVGEDVGDDFGPGPVLMSRLAIFDSRDSQYTAVEIETTEMVGRIIASHMMRIAAPTPEDLLDVMAELGNIVAGNVKSLLRHSCRLSLPGAELAPETTEETSGGVRVACSILGQPISLTVRPARPDGPAMSLLWPGSPADVLEPQS